MEHTKKFYFVPPDLLAKLNEKEDNLKRISTNLEKNVVKTISKKNVESTKLMPADKRAILYSQYLQKYLAHKNKLSSPISPIVKVSEIDKDKAKDKSKSVSISTESDIEKIKNDIFNLQTVFNQKYNELVQALPEYWRKGEELRHIDVSGIEQLPSSSYQRISTPLPRSSSLSAIINTEEDLARRFSTEREQLAKEQQEIRERGRREGGFEESQLGEDLPSEESEGTVVTGKRSSSKRSTRHRKGRTKSVQKIIESLTDAQVEALGKKLHERVTRSQAAPKQGGKGFSFNPNRWKTYYQYKL